MGRTWRDYFREKDERPPWMWAAGSLRMKGSPMGGEFNPELTPWLKEPLESIQDGETQEGTLQCCVQGGKSTFVTVAACWAMANEPAGMLYNAQTDPDAQEYAQERLRPALESCPAIAGKLPTDKSKNSLCYISFPDMFLLIQGANLSNLQSKTARWVFNDEVAFWLKGAMNPGLLDHARKRASKFYNRKIYNVSTAGEEGCDFDLAFKQGDMREWHLRCPECGELINPEFERLDFSSNPKCHPGGDWDLMAVKELTRLVCPHCVARIEQSESVHRTMNEGAVYIPMNPKPKPGRKSWRFNALCLPVHEITWGDLAVEYIIAKQQYDDGSDAAMKEVKTKRLALSWNPARMFFNPITTEKSDYMLEGLDLTPGKFWDQEHVRFMAVDVQVGHFWYVVRAFTRNGESRLVSEGKLLTWEHVREKQVEMHVREEFTVVDSGDQTAEVYEQCCIWGWRTMKGEDDKAFPHYEERNGERVKILRPYSVPVECDPYIGKRTIARKFRYAMLARWSNPTIKDFLARLKSGKGLYWSFPKDVSQTYLDQLEGERKIAKRNKVTGKTEQRWVEVGRRGNHLWDCECMLLVCACILKLLEGRFYEHVEPLKKGDNE